MLSDWGSYLFLDVGWYWEEAKSIVLPQYMALHIQSNVCDQMKANRLWFFRQRQINHPEISQIPLPIGPSSLKNQNICCPFLLSAFSSTQTWPSSPNCHSNQRGNPLLNSTGKPFHQKTEHLPHCWQKSPHLWARGTSAIYPHLWSLGLITKMFSILPHPLR